MVKASGLAAGKGAVVCATRKEAADAVRAMLETHTLGDAGLEVVIEEFMEGEELSVFALTNGRDLTLLPAAQDHKRLEEGDRGPNTGGMGAYSPVSLGTAALLTRVTITSSLASTRMCPSFHSMRSMSGALNQSPTATL